MITALTFIFSLLCIPPSLANMDPSSIPNQSSFDHNSSDINWTVLTSTMNSSYQEKEPNLTNAFTPSPASSTIATLLIEPKNHSSIRDCMTYVYQHVTEKQVCYCDIEEDMTGKSLVVKDGKALCCLRPCRESEKRLQKMDVNPSAPFCCGYTEPPEDAETDQAVACFRALVHYMRAKGEKDNLELERENVRNECCAHYMDDKGIADWCNEKNLAPSL